MNIEFEAYIAERDADALMRRARKEYFGEEKLKHVNRERPGKAIGEFGGGCRWIKAEYHE